MAQTFGQTLMAEHIPAKYRPQGAYTKKTFRSAMTKFAKEDPEQYAKSIFQVKRIGDEIATLDGISVGLDDIEPDYARRDPVLKAAMSQLHKSTDVDLRRKIIADTQSTLLDQAKAHTGTMGMMVRSGARGSAGQLMKAVVAPVGASDEKDEVTPWLVNKSYAEGLDHASWFVTNKEARQNAIKGVTSVSEPGDLGKILVSNTGGVVVTIDDCKTRNGVRMLPSSKEVLDRYEAGTRKLITTEIRQRWINENKAFVMVRSPMTCEAEDGVCQFCMGKDSRGKINDIGTNVGLRAATSLSEPLVQMQLSSKHATATAGGEKNPLSGTSGFRMLIESPTSFISKALLAPEDGTVTDVAQAPQGGWFITVNTQKLHTKQKPVVSKGAKVEKGDMLSSGVPRPSEVVETKGLGDGRQYLVEKLHEVYQSSGQNIDRRHLEILAKTNLNYVKINKIGDAEAEKHGLVRGDVLDYNKLHTITSANAETVPLDQAIGKTLGKGVLQHAAGTVVTDRIVRELKSANIRDVQISRANLSVTPMMAPATRNPLLNPDWAARLGHRYLTKTLLEGAHEGHQTNIHSTNPIPALLLSTEFGEGSRGKY